MRISIYVSESEHKWLKEQPAGYLRELLKQDMEVPGGKEWKESNEEKVVLATGNIKEKRVVRPKMVIGNKGDGLHTCSKCGYMLPYYGGRCKNGCK